VNHQIKHEKVAALIAETAPTLDRPEGKTMAQWMESRCCVMRSTLKYVFVALGLRPTLIQPIRTVKYCALP
jgi:hypothetical protein